MISNCPDKNLYFTKAVIKYLISNKFRFFNINFSIASYLEIEYGKKICFNYNFYNYYTFNSSSYLFNLRPKFKKTKDCSCKHRDFNNSCVFARNYFGDYN